MPFDQKEMGAVLCSHVLEHMPDLLSLSQAWSELHRVAESVFICVPTKASVFVWIHPDHHLWVSQVGATILYAEDRHTKQKALITAKGEILPIVSKARVGVRLQRLQRNYPSV